MFLDSCGAAERKRMAEALLRSAGKLQEWTTTTTRNFGPKIC